MKITEIKNKINEKVALKCKVTKQENINNWIILQIQDDSGKAVALLPASKSQENFENKEVEIVGTPRKINRKDGKGSFYRLIIEEIKVVEDENWLIKVENAIGIIIEALQTIKNKLAEEAEKNKKKNQEPEIVDLDW